MNKLVSLSLIVGLAIILYSSNKSGSNQTISYFSAPIYNKIRDFMIKVISNTDASELSALYSNNGAILNGNDDGKIYYHLEIGSGTGLQITRSNMTAYNFNILLTDIDEYAVTNANGFDADSTEKAVMNAMNKSDVDIKLSKYIKKYNINGFDSIGITGVLHCIPTPISNKLDIILGNLLPYMHDNTRFFGSTCLNDSWSSIGNIIKRFSDISTFNKDDTKTDLDNVLHKYFDDVNSRQIGAALWECYHPKNTNK